MSILSFLKRLTTAPVSEPEPQWAYSDDGYTRFDPATGNVEVEEGDALFPMWVPVDSTA